MHTAILEGEQQVISCNEFILCYSELFKFLDKRHNEKAVLDFWAALSDSYLGNLRKLAKKRGLQGLRIYWTHTLEEEGADYDMYCTPDSFVIDMHSCPSVGKLRTAKHLSRYKKYCDHCDVLYARVLNDYGMDFKLEKLDEKKGVCRCTVTRTPKKDGRRSKSRKTTRKG